jgi:hypothetical protein
MPGPLQNLIAAYGEAVTREVGGTAITYRLFVSSTVNPAGQTKIDQYFDVAIPYADREPVSIDDMTPGGVGPVQMDDETFSFRADLLDPYLAMGPKKALSTSDLITRTSSEFGVTTYRVIQVKVRMSTTRYQLIARRIS